MNYYRSYYSFLCCHYRNTINLLSHTLHSFAYCHCVSNDSIKIVNKCYDLQSKYITNSLPPNKPNLDLKFFYSNVRSLLPKFAFLNNYVSVYDPDVIAITETWLKEDTPSSLFLPRNYIPYRKDRTSSKGGGCLLLINQSTCIASKSVSLLSPEQEEISKIDAVACQLQLASGDKMGILCIYRPPGLNVSDNSILYDILNNFLNYRFKFNIIVGDFNFPDIRWPISSNSAQSDTFLSFIQENYLIQYVNLPTRRASQAILDLVLSTHGTNVSNLTVNEELSTSDHSIIEFCVPIGVIHKRRKVLVRNLLKADWSLFRSQLASLDVCKQIFESVDIDECWCTSSRPLN